MAEPGLTPSFAALLDEARRRGLTVEPMGWRGAVRLGDGVRNAWLMGTLTSRTSHLAALLAGDKAACKRVLGRAGVPTPEGELCRSVEAAVAAHRRLGRPVVVKPNGGAQGLDVRTGLDAPARIADACRPILARGGAAVVEAHHAGADLRVLVVDGRAVATSERRAPAVVGDGRRTVAELVAALNADPRRAPGHAGVMTLVFTGPDTVARLAEQGLALDAAPEAGRRVWLSHVANLSRGGEALDRTDDVAPAILQLAERAATAVGLDVAGVDLMAPDLRSAEGTVVFEVNCSPGLRCHLAPAEGAPRDVARPILDYLFPPEIDRRS